jgi:hypothetical protein
MTPAEEMAAKDRLAVEIAMRAQTPKGAPQGPQWAKAYGGSDDEIQKNIWKELAASKAAKQKTLVIAGAVVAAAVGLYFILKNKG